MNRSEKLLIFTLSGISCALPLAEIERILRAVEISPVPRAPEVVMGLVNIQGQIIPVLDLRKVLHLPDAEVGLNDQFIVARAKSRPVAILVDSVLGLSELDTAEIVPPDRLYPGIEFLEGVVGLQDGIIYIYDLAKLLTPADSVEISECLQAVS